METSSWISLGTGLVAGLGIGSAVTAYIQHFLKKRESAYQSQRQDLEKRYRVIILLMYAAFDYEKNKTSFRIQRPDLKNQQDVLDELKAEWYNMLLFASAQTLKDLHSFILDPNLSNLKNAAISMRCDLGRGEIGAVVDDLEF
jgi:hypothetical protein